MLSPEAKQLLLLLIKEVEEKRENVLGTIDSMTAESIKELAVRKSKYIPECKPDIFAQLYQSGFLKLARRPVAKGNTEIVVRLNQGAITKELKEDIKLKSLTSLLEQYSGKKIVLKEEETKEIADRDAFINMQNEIEVSLDSCVIGMIDQIKNFTATNRQLSFKEMNTLKQLMQKHIHKVGITLKDNTNWSN